MRISICNYPDDYSINKNEIAPLNLFPDLNLEEEIDLDLNLEELIECMENATCNESVKLEEQKKRTKYTLETKQKVADYIRQGFNQKAAAIQFRIPHFLVKEWTLYGSRTKKNKTCSVLFKKNVVRQLRAGQSLKNLVQKFDVCRSTIFRWARDPSLTKKTKHTVETKQKVADCIRQGFNQKAVAEHFGISYDLVKEWTLYGSRTKKNKTCSVLFKKNVVRQLRTGRSLKDLVQEFNVCRSTISKWARDPSLQAKIKKLRNRQVIFF